VELASGRAQTLVLGEWHAAMARGVTIGAADSCSVVLAAPGVAPVHACAYARGHHRYLLALAPGVRAGEHEVPPVTAPLETPAGEARARSETRIDAGPFALAGYELALGEATRDEPELRAELAREGGPLAHRARRTPAAALPDWFGPRTREVRAVLARCGPARWLRPAADVAALDVGARRKVEALLARHNDALLRPGATRRDPPRVTYVRALVEALQRWRDAWADAEEIEALAESRAGFAHVRAFDAAARLHAPYDPAERAYLARACAALAARAAPGSGFFEPDSPVGAALARLGGSVRGGASPVETLARAAIDHRLLIGSAEGCPFTPLLALWDRGCWPLAMPGGDWLVYVPRRAAADEPAQDAGAVAPRPRGPLGPRSLGPVDRYARCEPVMAFWSRGAREVVRTPWPAAPSPGPSAPAALVVIEAPTSPPRPGRRFPLGLAERYGVTSDHVFAKATEGGTWSIVETIWHAGQHHVRDGGGFFTVTLNGDALGRGEAIPLRAGDVLQANVYELRFEPG
jgi:hypothetical protein